MDGIGIIVGLVCFAGNFTVLWVVSRRKNEAERSALRFIQQQTVIYMICCLAFSIEKTLALILERAWKEDPLTEDMYISMTD